MYQVIKNICQINFNNSEINDFSTDVFDSKIVNESSDFSTAKKFFDACIPTNSPNQKGMLSIEYELIEIDKYGFIQNPKENNGDPLIKYSWFYDPKSNAPSASV